MKAVIYTLYMPEGGSPTGPDDLSDDPTQAEQVMICRDFAKEHGYEVIAVLSDATHAREYLNNRPGLQEVFRMADERLMDAVIFSSADRLSASHTYLQDYEEYLENRGVKSIYVDTFEEE